MRYVCREDTPAETRDEQVVPCADEEGGEDYEGAGNCIGWLSVIISIINVFRKLEIEKGRTYDGVRILDRYSADDVSSNFETYAKQHSEEVVRFVVENRLVELDEHGDGVEGCEDDREWEIGVVEPDGVGV